MKLKALFTGALAGLMFSESAFALSCARPDLVTTLEEAKASPKIYHILVGKFRTLDPRPKQPAFEGYTSPEDQFKPKPPQIKRSYFEGYSLAKSPRRDYGLTRFPVDIETSCVGPWCTDVPSADRNIIAFVEAREGLPPILKISPCPYWTFEAAPKKVKKLRQCLDKTCEPETPNW